MVVAIQKAEKNTSGEIRIHIENHFTGNILDRAAKVFAQLKMHKTALRNGVLIYVALQDHQLAISKENNGNLYLTPVRNF